MMPLITIGLFIACAISSVLAPAFLAVATVSYWPLLFYAPYLLTFWFFNEWQEIESAPKDGTRFIGGFWSIRWADSHRKGDVVTCWWQPEFEAFISECREMQMHNGYTFEDGSTRKLHSPTIEPVTHWMPLPAPPSRVQAVEE